jgi:hypothetical protein
MHSHNIKEVCGTLLCIDNQGIKGQRWQKEREEKKRGGNDAAVEETIVNEKTHHLRARPEKNDQKMLLLDLGVNQRRI